MRRYLLSALVGLMVASGAAGFVVSSAGASPAPDHLVSVTKDIEGTPTGGSFEVTVTCLKGNGNETEDSPKTFVFSSDGGTHVFSFLPAAQTCTVAETDTGGASNVAITGSPCDFTSKESADIGQLPPTCDVTVTNTFTPPTPGPQGPAGATILVPTPVQAPARFTG
jgi:Domain of unknown function (DUF5979)